jgi:hypothetical protein
VGSHHGQVHVASCEGVSRWIARAVEGSSELGNGDDDEGSMKLQLLHFTHRPQPWAWTRPSPMRSRISHE